MSGLAPRYIVSVALRGGVRSVLNFAPVPSITIDVALSPFLQGDPGPTGIGVAGPPGAGVQDDPGDFTLIFDNQLI